MHAIAAPSIRYEKEVRDLSDLGHYLNAISKWPILDKERELKLAKSKSEGDEEAFWELYLCNLRLVVAIAKRFSRLPGSLVLADHIQNGNMGLKKAVEAFDYRRDCRFSTDATYWVRHVILREYEETGAIIKKPTYVHSTLGAIRRAESQFYQRMGEEPTLEEWADEAGMPFERFMEYYPMLFDPAGLDALDGDRWAGSSIWDEPREGEQSFDQVEMTDSATLGELIESAIVGAKLDKNENLIIAKRFGFDCAVPKTLEETGKLLNLSRERARQIEKKALKKLEMWIATEGVKGYGEFVGEITSNRSGPSRRVRAW